MDKIPLQFLASIENNTDTTTAAFSYNIENDLPFIMSALEQNLNLKEDQTENDNSDDKDDESSGCSSTPISQVHRRRSPRAKSMDSKLHKIKRRTIAKPVKFQINLNASENEIRNYYMVNSKKVDVKPTNLETIFEEGSPAATKDKFFGQRKVRRSLNCSDGFNVNKTTTKARKNRVRKLLGGAPKHERMTMDTFLERLKAMQNESDEDGERIVDPKLNQTV
ncbi:protein tantalus [Ochlerotatus camptorhynchus]|uniref:protein tantalus n=1 Tax=Ochlerotatus camptorhynchus TaxID=644619 RepID=UPI0031CDEA51